MSEHPYKFFHLSSWIIKAFLFTILMACVPCVFLFIEFQIFSLFCCIRLFWVGKYGYSTCKDNFFQVSEVIFSVLTFRIVIKIWVDIWLHVTIPYYVTNKFLALEKISWVFWVSDFSFVNWEKNTCFASSIEMLKRKLDNVWNTVSRSMGGAQ